MEERSPLRTSASLLGRLRLDAFAPEDSVDFERRHTPMIRAWCRRWGLQEADSEDITQDVLARLAARMRRFEYDPSKSFRALVKTLAYFPWCDLIESRKRPGAVGSGDTALLDRLDAIEARDDPQARLADAFDREILEEASARVRLRIEPRTW